MKLEDYIEKAKKELDDLQNQFVESNKKDPDMWPLEMEETDWGDQELAARFGQI